MSGEAGAGAGAGAGGGGARGRVSPEQVEILLAFMEEHSEFALGKQSVYSRFSASKLWRLLAERLNGAAAAGAGGTRKSPDKWCRYWADMKYKARRKSAAGGALGELSATEERLRGILGATGAAAGGRERRAGSVDSDAASAGSAGERADELLAEAALRQALAAEKQAEAVTQGVELLRELVSVLSQRLPVPVTVGVTVTRDANGGHQHHSHSLLHHHNM